MSASPDVVVVGSGLGGLTAAALLARSGRRVEVHERHHQAGGYATTFQRARGSVVFDVSLHGIGGLGPGGLVRKNLELCGVWDRLRPIETPDQYRAILPEHDIRVPQRDVEAYLDLLTRHFPGEREGLAGLVQEIGRTYEQYARLQENHFRDLPRNFRAYDAVVKYSRIPQKALLDTYLSDERLKSLFSAQWSYHGAPPSKVPAIAFINTWSEYMHGGAHYLEGSCQSLVRGLTEVIHECGGAVHLKSGVRRITVEDGRATGIELEDGRAVRCAIVIANASPQDVVGQLAGREHFPAEYCTRVEALRPSLSTFLTFVALDRDLREIAGGTEDYNVVVTPSYDLDEVYGHSLRGDVANAELTVVNHGNLGPRATGRSAGSQIALFALSTHEPWARMDRGTYRAAKAAATESMLARLERLYPGVRRHVTLVESATPLTNVRYTGNPGGAIYGWEKDVAQSARTRTMSKTPVENLYLSSAWAFPGGGYSGAIWAGYFCVYENGLTT